MTIQACLYLDPSPGESMRERMEQIGNLVMTDNAAWIAEHVDQGSVVPCCSFCAGIEYVEYHGAPVGICREYWGASQMFSHGRGTCVDIAAYDAAACNILQGIPASVVVVHRPPMIVGPDGDAPQLFHAVVAMGAPGQQTLIDPTLKWTNPEASAGACPCGA